MALDSHNFTEACAKVGIESCILVLWASGFYDIQWAFMQLKES